MVDKEDKEIMKNILKAMQDIAKNFTELNKKLQMWDMTGIPIKKKN